MPKAVRFEKYGGIDVLKVVDVDRPVPQAGQVLVQVKAAGINPGEAAIREGWFAELFPATFPCGEGSDFAGVVVEVHPGPNAVARAIDPSTGVVRGAWPLPSGHAWLDGVHDGVARISEGHQVWELPLPTGLLRRVVPADAEDACDAGDAIFLQRDGRLEMADEHGENAGPLATPGPGRITGCRTRASLALRFRMWWARRWSWRVLAKTSGPAVQICCGFVDEVRCSFPISSLPAALDVIARTPLGEPWLTPGGYLVLAPWVPVVGEQLATIERAWRTREGARA